jgi:8-amino-7-oxononanoate synthase
MKDTFLKQILEKRNQEGLFRSLGVTWNFTDFCSNDYLGFARSSALQKIYTKKIVAYEDTWMGSTGSRLISGNSQLAEHLESKIAKFHHAETGLIFNSGYDANVGLFSSIAQKNDTIITDEWIHASIIDGCRLSYANRYHFKHNDLEDLEAKLKQAKGNVFVAIESIYSMDGDVAPLKEISQLCEQYNAYLIVDEAHATGILGDKGRGLVCALGLENAIFARVHTFGKALGTHGAIVLGSKDLRHYLINFARSFIYTTAISPHSLVAVDCAYDFLKENDYLREDLYQRVIYFKQKIAKLDKYEVLPSGTPIQGIMVEGNEKAKKLADILLQERIHTKAILSPTVPMGRERLRICLHSFNTLEDIDNLIYFIKNASNL